MKSLAHLSDAALRHELIAAVARDRITTAELLAHIAEFDARKLYVPEGYSSMHAYCVGELHLSEDAAYKRIRAARAGHRFPALLLAIEEGRIHLAAAYLVAAHLTQETADELIGAVTHRSKAEVEELLARRFPGYESAPMISSIRPVFASVSENGTVGGLFKGLDSQPPRGAMNGQVAPGPAERGLELSSEGEREAQLAPGPVDEPKVEAARRYLVQVTIEEGTYEKLRRIQALLSHAVPSVDVAQVLDRAFDRLLESLETRKAGAVAAHGSRSRSARARRHPAKARYIPAQIRRAVWERDGGQCTFVSKTGHRCGERRFLEFDHVEPVARGGAATVNGLRLRCRAHNQYEAERAFGVGFMSRKRQNARLTRVRAHKCTLSEEQAARAAIQEQSQDVLAGLRSLGCRGDEARRAAQFTENLEGASLEERMRAALGYISRRFTHGSGSTGSVLHV